MFQWETFIQTGLSDFRSFESGGRAHSIFVALFRKYRASKVYVDPRNHQRKRQVVSLLWSNIQTNHMTFSSS